MFVYVKYIFLFFFLKRYFYFIKINCGRIWNIGSMFYICVVVGCVIVNLISDVIVYNLICEEKYDCRS